MFFPSIDKVQGMKPARSPAPEACHAEAAKTYIPGRLLKDYLIKKHVKKGFSAGHGSLRHDCSHQSGANIGSQFEPVLAVRAALTAHFSTAYKRRNRGEYFRRNA
jgi:hypothetical protein